MTLASLPTAALAAYWGTILVFARMRPLVPFALIRHLPDALYPAGLSSSVALCVLLATAIVVHLATRLLLKLDIRRAAAAGFCVGAAYAAGVLLFGYFPDALVDSIPGFTYVAWSILGTSGLAGVAAATWLTASRNFSSPPAV
jgi:hypothetical protein